MNLVKAVQYEVSKMIQKAMEDYYFTVGHKLSDPGLSTKSYWCVLNRLLNRKNSVNIPLLLDNGLFITNALRKANLLNDYFIEQCSIVTTGSTLPTFKPRPISIPQYAAIDREKMLNIIRVLDSNKALSWNEVSIHSFM